MGRDDSRTDGRVATSSSTSSTKSRGWGRTSRGQMLIEAQPRLEAVSVSGRAPLGERPRSDSRPNTHHPRHVAWVERTRNARHAS